MAMTEVQEEVHAALDQMLDAMNAGDAERLRSLLSERADAVHIGSDPGEWSTSNEFADDVAGSTNDVMLLADDIGTHVQGEVAWAEGRGRFRDSSGNQRPFRMTGVLVREDGRWKVAQLHVSIGVPNAEIFS